MLVKVKKGIPLMGCIAFGIIDRGTNMLQVRATSLCNLNCRFCSVDSGNDSKWHPNFYEVDLDYLLEEIEKIVNFKGGDVEINIDSVGEPFCYPKLEELVDRLRNLKGVSGISIQTNGTIWKDIDVDVINVSLHSLDVELGKKLAGKESYSVEQVKEFAEKYKEKGVKVRICPVWIPKINDSEIEKIIVYAKEKGFDLGIQKYDIYKYSRKVRGGKTVNWWKFYKQLEIWEEKFDVKLKMDRKELGIEKRERVPEVMKKGEKVKGIVVAPGWLRGQRLASVKGRCVSVNDCDRDLGDIVNIKILETKNNLYIAE